MLRTFEGAMHHEEYVKSIEGLWGRISLAAVEYIKKNFPQKITLGEVAQTLSMSPEHLSRTFRKETGIGFNRYLNLIRLQHAETLLKTTDMTVSEIAEACGFGSVRNFNRVFQDTLGITPSEYRKTKL